QHELAPIFTTTNIATDHNQLTMEIMKKVAQKHGLVCLLHEKPFDGVNGSGKHNNWSMSTDTGANLLEPGDTPYENAQFLLFLTAVIKAVDDYQDLMRISVTSAGNDHRLGANEAPPAVISIFLGSELTEILEAIETDQPYGAKEKELLKVGVHVLPKFPKDTTDRNRTSPFAFTGNKFEFRMPGSSASVALPNTVLNTAVAESLKQFADELEGASDFTATLHDLIQKEIKAHKRIIFNGNGYSDEWIEEAAKRGLSNLRTTPDAIAHYLDAKNVQLFTSHKVYSEVEMQSRHEVFLEKYNKLLDIESKTMLEIAKQDILPAVSAYSSDLAGTVVAKKEALGISPSFEVNTLTEISADLSEAYEAYKALSEDVDKTSEIGDQAELANFYKDQVIPSMESLRKICDKLETETASEYWPFPTYGELLFAVR
ncbi:MAG: glutamine synthetase type III, partial [Clostridiales bacterium]|nr:glutamine synthetase type III [Clostridiales bacterium]